MNPAIENWWRSRNARERLILFWGGLIGLIMFVYGAIWVPWQNKIDHLETELTSRIADLAWMLAVDHAAPQTVIASTSDITPDSVLTAIDRIAQKHGLRDTIQTITPQADGKAVRVVQEEVAFNKWVGWVDELQGQQQLYLIQVDIQKSGVGLATVRATFSRQL